MLLNRRACLDPVLRHGLYLVPERRTPRAEYVPAARTLHLLDVENLAGGSGASQSAVESALGAYRAAVGVAAVDHVVLSTGVRLAYPARSSWAGAKLVLGRGLDGADLALLDQLTDLDWVAARFDRVIVGSGDGIFADALRDLRSRGVAVGVVARVHSISWKLRRMAHFACEIMSEVNTRGVA